MLKMKALKQSTNSSKKSYLCLLFLLMVMNSGLKASLITAGPGNYTTFLNTLISGDTLLLTSGVYTNNLTLNGLNGTITDPIVIFGMGDSTIFQGQSCCNTISLTQCSFLEISNFKLEGQGLNIDAVKAEGTPGNWVHHLTISYLNISGYNASQQNVGISTKCAAWDCVFRKNIIKNTGTGMYLGNSNGENPFVNGLIEYNFIGNTMGYNIEIKHQLDTVRDDFAGTSVDGKTIISHNVFSKDSGAASGSNARPNLLVGGFPLTGWGAQDYYEIYGNLFYNNPTEALFQGTGNIMMYQNIFINQVDPSGGQRAVYFTPQNGVSPQDIKVFHNTVWTANSNGGIRIYNPDPGFQQYCYGNAVFSAQAITNFTDTLHNITDDYANAGNYFLSAGNSLNTINLYPQVGQLTGPLTVDTLFQSLSAWQQDFNGDLYDWTYRGAYSGCCSNPGWTLQLDTMFFSSVVNQLQEDIYENLRFVCFPNPVINELRIAVKSAKEFQIDVFSIMGQKMISVQSNKEAITIPFDDYPTGIYYIIIAEDDERYVFKLNKI